MYKLYIICLSLGSVENFCDMTEDNLHDTELPTKQNLYCDQRSTWEVSCSWALFQIFFRCNVNHYRVR